MAKSCTSCGAPLFWAIHFRTGNPAPINSEPTPNGNIVISYESGSGGIQTIYRILHSDEEYDGERYTNHWMDCPHRDEWRRRLAEKDKEQARE